MAFKTLLAALCGVAFTMAPSVSSEDAFAYGADPSSVTKQEFRGFSFYDKSGAKADPFVLMKNLGVNAIRLRVWVNPSEGWCNAEDSLVKAKRAAALGQRIMLDFHYSDDWAAPDKQITPAAWAGHTLEQLGDDVYKHTEDTLNLLKNNGIDVEWVQVGNEISNGMLWPGGQLTPDLKNLAGLINRGYDATKAVFPNAKVIVHCNNGHIKGLLQWFYPGLTKAGAKFDVIGLSFYPPLEEWAHYNDLILDGMKDMVSTIGKPVMVVETGMEWFEPATTKAMLTDLISKMKTLKNYGQGVFYWEPNSSPGLDYYPKGAVDEKWQFTTALEAYREAAAQS